jgi:hypothetical protein
MGNTWLSRACAEILKANRFLNWIPLLLRLVSYLEVSLRCITAPEDSAVKGRTRFFNWIASECEPDMRGKEIAYGRIVLGSRQLASRAHKYSRLLLSPEAYQSFSFKHNSSVAYRYTVFTNVVHWWYRSGGPGSIPGTTRKRKVVGLERSPLNLVSTTEELKKKKN